ncbi:Hypothetical predicted protein [Prunus dulcis]|uniref:Uncharacterized protein n=1 Tax=Prunus dulcis TaxID=3755 RepID=A0A5E4GFI0_PRUDU|nr:Hypothetical predicted protein [Prunus dulcis]
MVPVAGSVVGMVVPITRGGCCGAAAMVCYSFMAARGGGATMSIAGSWEEWLWAIAD